MKKVYMTGIVSTACWLESLRVGSAACKMSLVNESELETEIQVGKTAVAAYAVDRDGARKTAQGDAA